MIMGAALRAGVSSVVGVLPLQATRDSIANPPKEGNFAGAVHWRFATSAARRITRRETQGRDSKAKGRERRDKKEDHPDQKAPRRLRKSPRTASCLFCFSFCFLNSLASFFLSSFFLASVFRLPYFLTLNDFVTLPVSEEPTALALASGVEHDFPLPFGRADELERADVGFQWGQVERSDLGARTLFGRNAGADRASGREERRARRNDFAPEFEAASQNDRTTTAAGDGVTSGDPWLPVASSERDIVEPLWHGEMTGTVAPSAPVAKNTDATRRIPATPA